MKLQILAIKKVCKVDSNHTFFSSNQRGFCSQKRWKLLSTSHFKRLWIYSKKIVRHINDTLSDFSYSDESGGE